MMNTDSACSAVASEALEASGVTTPAAVFTFDASDVISLSSKESYPEAHQPPKVPEYLVDVQQWRDTSGFGGGGNFRYGGGGGGGPDAAAAAAVCQGFWRPAYGGYPVSVPSSGLSRESSRDDLTSMEGQMFEYEERFQVDRRKLEMMMIGRFEPVKEAALDFFQRIGEQTSTTIIWPSRLKIGAKSKKDPHIRIGGTEECVKRAKQIIMEYLDTRSTRVTMKMDVSYTDHSHVIGKGGNTIRRVMAETGCHVHFPDSNRSNPTEKSNQVSIAGEMEGVEKARARVRELSPLVFTFDLPLVPTIEAIPHDINDPYLKAIQDQYNIQVMFRQKQKNFPTTVVVVKGCEWESSRVKEATTLLVDHLYGRYSSSPTAGAAQPGLEGGERPTDFFQNVPISMNIEISPIHHSVVLGKSNMALRSIMQRTKTTILFPDATDPNIPPIRKGSVSISGSIHNVYFARQQLLGSLPIVMMFEMPDNFGMLDETGIQKMQMELDVCISIKSKQRMGNKSVFIKAQERNASAMYKARHILFGLDDGDLVEAHIPETYKMLQQNSGDSFFNLNNSNDPSFRLPTVNKPFPGGFNPMLMHHSPHHPIHQHRFLNYHHMEADPTNPMALLAQRPAYPPPPPMMATKPGFMNPMQKYFMPPSPLPQQQAAFAGNGGLPPNHPYLQDYARLVLQNITRLQQQEQQNSAIKDDPNNNYVSQDERSPGRFMPRANGISPRNSSPVHNLGNMTNHLAGLDLDASRVSECNGGEGRGGSTSSGSGMTSGAEYYTSSGGSKGTPRISSSSETSDGGQSLCDWRAPGWGTKNGGLEMAAGASSQICEYDAKRLLAAKALQTKPSANEPRNPTTTWSGLGFSNSMPEAMIREQLGGDDVAAAVESPTTPTSAAPLPKPTPPPPNATAAAVSVATGTNWFGNSSALDSFFNSKTFLASDPDHLDDDLPSLFAKQGLAKYTDFFLRHEVDMVTFASLTEQDLKEIGIQTFGARKKLLLLANKVKQLLSANDSVRNRPW